jgi:SAM-dependent methyltransferase
MSPLTSNPNAARTKITTATRMAEDVEVLLELGAGPTSTVVDLGAGTGTFAQAIAPYVARVVAVDVSEPMVAAMRARGLEAVCAGFLSYEHEGDSPDAVFTWNALHHLSDFWKAVALGRIARLLGPGGVLRLRDLVYSFQPQQAEEAISSWLDAAPKDPARGWTAAQLAEHVRDGIRPLHGSWSRCSSAPGSRSVTDG